MPDTSGFSSSRFTVLLFSDYPNADLSDPGGLHFSGNCRNEMISGSIMCLRIVFFHNTPRTYHIPSGILNTITRLEKQRGFSCFQSYLKHGKRCCFYHKRLSKSASARYIKDKTEMKIRRITFSAKDFGQKTGSEMECR